MQKYSGLTVDQWSWFYVLSLDGLLRHNPDRPEHTFATEAAYKRFHTLHSGQPVTSSPDTYGYALCRPMLDGQKIVGMRHLVVWFLHHGWLPAKGHRVSHLDGNRLNDCPSNLAILDRQEPNPNNIIYAYQTNRGHNAHATNFLHAQG